VALPHDLWHFLQPCYGWAKPSRAPGTCFSCARKWYMILFVSFLWFVPDPMTMSLCDWSQYHAADASLLLDFLCLDHSATDAIQPCEARNDAKIFWVLEDWVNVCQRVELTRSRFRIRGCRLMGKFPSAFGTCYGTPVATQYVCPGCLRENYSRDVFRLTDWMLAALTAEQL